MANHRRFSVEAANKLVDVICDLSHGLVGKNLRMGLCLLDGVGQGTATTRPSKVSLHNAVTL
jgi:hypothetical protein